MARSSCRRSRRGSGRGSRRACARRGAPTLEHRLDYAGRPGNLTVQSFIGLKAALALLLGLGVGGLLLLLGSNVIFIVAARR